jgi:hypothetical protein
MLFRGEEICVYSENNTKPRIQSMSKIESCWALKRVVHIFTNVLQSVKRHAMKTYDDGNVGPHKTADDVSGKLHASVPLV